MKKYIFLILLTLILIAGCSSNNSYNKDFFKCLNEKATLYISTGCPACAVQEKILGEGIKDLKVVNCRETPEECTKIDLEFVPTWSINGNNYEGVKELEALAQITGCSL